jgi:ligand-binding sensor domain-containing protein
MVMDLDSNLWLASYEVLMRFNLKTHHIDSFPFLKNADYRTLALIRDKLFIGTYGKGYYVYSNGRFIHMPSGRNHELSNTHSFIADPYGYLWIPTNRGLYATRLDAIDAFLKILRRPSITTFTRRKMVSGIQNLMEAVYLLFYGYQMGGFPSDH